MTDNLPKRIKENKSYKEWLESLTEDQKVINNKLLDLLSTRLDIDADIDNKAVDSMIESIASVINNVESDELISELESSNGNDSKLLFKLMANIAKSEDINHANLIRKRIEAIKKLQDLIDDESTIEKYLKNIYQTILG